MTCVPLWYSPVTRVWGYIEAGNETSVEGDLGMRLVWDGVLGMRLVWREAWE